MGVNATWGLIDELTPAVPFLKRVVDHVEKSFGLEHSTKHIIPNPLLETRSIMRTLSSSSAFDYHPNRQDLTDEGNTPKDFATIGEIELQDTKYLNELWKERWSYIKRTSTLEDYAYPPVNESGNDPKDSSATANDTAMDPSPVLPAINPGSASIQDLVNKGSAKEWAEEVEVGDEDEEGGEFGEDSSSEDEEEVYPHFALAPDDLLSG
jgi:hypothetical protein